MADLLEPLVQGAIGIVGSMWLAMFLVVALAIPIGFFVIAGRITLDAAQAVRDHLRVQDRPRRIPIERRDPYGHHRP